MKKLYIGIDPDVTKSGIAFLTSYKEWKLETCELFLIKELIFDTMADFKVEGLVNVSAKVETPLTGSASFGEYGKFKANSTRFKMSGFGNAEKSAFNSSIKVASQKGRCSQIGEEICKLFKYLSITTERIAPSKRIRFDGYPFNKTDVKEIRRLIRSTKKYQYPSKMNHERFAELIGIPDKRTNSEKRDSALLLVKTYLNL
jgi:hypothetical protein